MNERLASTYRKLTNKNTRTGKPVYYGVYGTWAVAVSAAAITAASPPGLVVLYGLLGIGALFVLVHVVWWNKRTVPYRFRVFYRKVKTAYWRRKVAKTYRPITPSPTRQLTLLRKHRDASERRRPTIETIQEQSP